MDTKSFPRLVIGILVAAVVLWLVYLLRQVMTPVFIALLLAYLLDPLMDRFERHGVNRTLAILLTGGALILLLGLLLGFLLTQAQKEIILLYQSLPDYLTRIQDTVIPFIEEHFRIHIPITNAEITEKIKEQIAKINPETLKPLTALLGKITSSTIALIGWLVGLLIIPVFLFYFLRDWDVYKAKLVALLPLAHRDAVLEKAAKVDAILGAFIRGQLMVCAILAVLYSAGLLLVGINLAVLIGVSAGILFIVPYLGTILGIVAATIMALLEYGFAWQVLGAWGVFAVVQFLEGYFITPKIVGHQLGLSPVVVIFSLLVGADLLGIVGMLIAVPVAAVCNVFLQDALERYRKSSALQPQEKENQNGDTGHKV
jgi:predicted PurR-regulated permease PerM